VLSVKGSFLQHNHCQMQAKLPLRVNKVSRKTIGSVHGGGGRNSHASVGGAKAAAEMAKLVPDSETST
jgi:hypothetical protein